MKSLVINTTSTKDEIGVFDKQKIVSETSGDQEVARNQSNDLGLTVSKVLSKGKLKIQDIDLIIVALGPGSYTGSRSGLAFTKAVSHASKTRIVGVSLLDVAAYTIQARDFPLTIALEAGPDRYYTKTLKKESDMTDTRKKGGITSKENLPKNTHTIEVPDLTSILEFGLIYFDKNGEDKFDLLLPLYLKEPNITKSTKDE